MGFDYDIAFCYVRSMRDHQQILVDAGSDGALAAQLGPDVKPFNVRDWRLRNSIPAERWKRVVDLGFATYEELAEHVSASDPANDDADPEAEDPKARQRAA